MTDFPKLVRDNIPARMQLAGMVVETEELNPGQAREWALQKLVEEAREALATADWSKGPPKHRDLVAEIADVEDVLALVKRVHHVRKDELERAKRKKRLAAGGFTKRILVTKAAAAS